ncbi:MAG: tRNA (N6-isopentenyl adenosine(37)-C2)-methylthiotransferase MiaB [Clostridiales Family XIII bacterium]|jgi:tRNA-2-methylthio-N6-dimethylallyladenosine synthase|nr:tRNA (N6-isopentenyl adenosine(37)-C2)-methylthiotransferase MiaB [Clostridiales Family XIII bacterium]
MEKYLIITMGCQMNERDSETLAGMLEAAGLSKTGERADADVIIVNTCSVRENADDRFFGVLGQLKKFKTAKPDAVVAVCGCMMQQRHIVNRVRAKYPWVDLVFGTHNIDAFPKLFADVRAERVKIVAVRESRAGIVEGLPAKREYPFKAYVNIMYGCNNFCAYCIVPYTRGREVSRAPGHILAEIRALAADGTKEVTLLGQNVNSYDGADDDNDNNNGRVDFADLIARLEGVSGLERVRFMTSHPKDLSDKLIALFETSEKLCPGIHLPVQSGSDRVLARMNRKYDRERYLELIGKLRRARPDIVITTDFIVGFPGETEEDFSDTMALIRRVRFDSAFTFLFSPRTGTPAADDPDQVPEAVKHERFDRMAACLNEITLEKNKAYLGRTENILIEGPAKSGRDMLAGRTFGGKLVNVKAPRELAGAIVPVRIVGVNTFSFVGEIVAESK